jgi:3-oxoacyl-[acyl-carrier protein] reductase
MSRNYGASVQSEDALPLAGRIALVGGGSRGIGRAAALRLARAGADVAVAARHQEAGLAVAQEIRALGRRSLFIRADLADYDSAEVMAGTVVEEYGGIDILVVSGGGGGAGEALLFAETDPRTFPDYLVGQLLTRLNAIAAVLPSMRARGYGKIVVVTTDAGRVPTTGEALFGGAAAALMFIVRAAGRELSRDGLRLNAVAITVTQDTGTWESYLTGDVPGPIMARVFRRIEDASAFGLNTPSDVAEAIYFLASPGSDQISGATISVNGGVSFP